MWKSGEGATTRAPVGANNADEVPRKCDNKSLAKKQIYTGFHDPAHLLDADAEPDDAERHFWMAKTTKSEKLNKLIMRGFFWGLKNMPHIWFILEPAHCKIET